ncbi:MAG: signal peptidase I [Anaerolineales bacterium]|nr:signal peptidase I [Anaerolineales bacterium]
MKWLARAAWELVSAFLPAIVIALFINVYVAEAVEIEDGPSMQPNLYVGYRVMTEKISYRLHSPQRGDVVVVVQPNGQPALIKRVAALEGQIVAVVDGRTFIDGQPVDEPWVVYFGGPDYYPRQVPDDHIFILGDNRAVSHDSRAIGPVPLDSVLGRAWLIYWPLEQARLLP